MKQPTTDLSKDILHSAKYWLLPWIGFGFITAYFAKKHPKPLAEQKYYKAQRKTITHKGEFLKWSHHPGKPALQLVKIRSYNNLIIPGAKQYIL